MDGEFVSVIINFALRLYAHKSREKILQKLNAVL